MRCLGLTIDSDLSWRSHVDILLDKIGRKVGVLRRVWRQMSAKARRLYLLGVIQPDLEYCSVAYLTSLPAAGGHRLIKIFRRALRAAAGADPQADCEQLLRDQHVQPLTARWLLQLGCFVYVCCKEPPAMCLAELFQFVASNYRTRGQEAGNLVVPLFNRQSGASSVSRRLAVLWNAFPTELKSCPSLPLFRSSLCALLSDPQVSLRYSSLVFDSLN